MSKQKQAKGKFIQKLMEHIQFMNNAFANIINFNVMATLGMLGCIIPLGCWVDD
jgi:hypothetical protein